MLKKVFLQAQGNVQNVMFRQTILKLAHKIGITAGATNCYFDESKVDISIMGKDEKIKEFIEVLKPGKKLNSWGAQIDSLEIAENGRDPLNHQINTENFNNINWRTDIVYYI